MTISFPARVTIEECEKFIRKIVESPDEDLLLPLGAGATAFGGWAASMQAINTWGRTSVGRRVLLKGGMNGVDKIVEESISQPHKFCAAMWAKDIREQSTWKDVRRSFLSLAEEKIDFQSTSAFGQQKGRLCWYLFVDHSTKGFDRSFYIKSQDRNVQPRQLSQIGSIISRMTKKSICIAGGGQLLDGDDAEYLGRIFYELFLNTHEHGSRGESRLDWLRPGLRSIYTNGININQAGADNALVSINALKNYLFSLNVDSNAQKRFIELSIVDSGLGYCGRWMADRQEAEGLKNLTLNEEYKILKKCFSFRQTSSGSITKGLGLPVVMDRLTKLKGFMRVRSGRLSLYRDFSTNPYLQDDTCDFYDWELLTPANVQLQDMAPVSGVAVTLLIPLEAK
ncbi:hypothetical protein [Chromobacterium sp. LK11]|uniref:hypothetical protein n=1 Tax=Chromobacterium sp. LK11 TaxID=1628212 RepID=UPI0009E25795|nr:hypothetical protein [Chromobacterium sp. LK11]